MTDYRDIDDVPIIGDGAPGRLLSGPSLTEALQRTDHVFRDGSWNPAQVRGAGYDLRLASDLLVVPAEPGGADYKVVDKNTPGLTEFRLAPGDSALISTIEKLSMDFDIAATIGPKFRWSAKGLLVLHGSVAHPGYGRVQNPEDGQWVPKEDERLYFIVANIGPADIMMRAGDPIAYLQFFHAEEPEVRRATPNEGFETLRDRLFRPAHDDSGGGLAYFRDVKDLRQALTKEETDRDADWAEFKRETERTTEDLKRQVTEAQTAVDRVNNATNMVVVFGVFLVAITLLGFALTTMVDLVEKLPKDISSGRVTIVAILVVVYAFSCIVGVAMVTRAVRATVRRATPRK